jgi:ribosomal protein S18 acetylase RimI-like enzyme
VAVEGRRSAVEGRRSKHGARRTAHGARRTAHGARRTAHGARRTADGGRRVFCSTVETPRSLVLATDIDVLPVDRVVRRDDDHLVIRCPSNPHHWWGNFLIFDSAPRAGDGERWEARFAAAFADAPEVTHRAFTWDAPDGAEGAVIAEFGDRGYEVERSVGLIATPDEITPPLRADHPRASGAGGEIEIRALDAGDGLDDPLWAGALGVQLANEAADPQAGDEYESFARARQRDRRALFGAGRGAWYVAIDHEEGAVVAGCGVIATGTRGRFQAVDTVPSHRRRGIASALVAHAAADAAARHGLHSLVIVADPDYHAIGIYRALGFTERERTCAARRSSSAPGGVPGG